MSLKKITLLTSTAASLFALTAFAGVETKVVSTATEKRVEIHIKPEIQKTDVLIVVDNSGSMDVSQSQLANEARALAKTLATSRYSLNVGVITTSIEDKGRFLNGPRHSDQPNFESEVALDMMVGFNGSSMEQPFASILAALSPAMLSTSNRDFLRDDADLAIILITDSEDQSPAAAADLVQALKTLKGDLSRVSFAAVVGEPSSTSCPNGYGEDEPLRIKELASLLGGSTTSICSANYSNVLAKAIKIRPVGVERNVELGMTPKLNTLSVMFGSRQLLFGDARGGFVYDSVTNSVVLGDLIDWGTEPVGTEIVISFVPTIW